MCPSTGKGHLLLPVEGRILGLPHEESMGISAASWKSNWLAASIIPLRT